MPARIAPTSIATAGYHHRQVIDKVRPAARSDRKDLVAVAVAPVETDFANAISFSCAGTACLSTLGQVTFGKMQDAFGLNQSDRQTLIIRLLASLNELPVKGEIVSAAQIRDGGLTKIVEARAREVIDAGLVVVENNVLPAPGTKWLPEEMVATVIGNIAKAITLVYSLGVPSTHMRALQDVLNGERKCKALSVLISIGWHLDRLEDLLRPLVVVPISETARIEQERQQRRTARAKETTLIVVHPEVVAITYWSLWRLANHNLVAPPTVRGLLPVAEAV